MNSVLQKIAAACGFILFLIALAIGLLRDVPIVSALYRAVMIMLLGTVVVGLFFQFFAKVLHRFIEEQHRQAEEEAARAAEEAAAQKKEQERRRPTT